MSSVSSSLKWATSSPKVFLIAFPLVLSVFCDISAHGSENKEVTEVKNATFSQSPTNHEEVLSKNKAISTTTGRSDDYWVGTHKLEFKPHPLLMPSTQTPAAQIPIPIIELGMPPTLTPAEMSDEDSSEEERPKKTKRKSRDKRKKSRRDQRRLAHRTLWSNSSVTNPYLSILPQNTNPPLIQQQQQQQQYSNVQSMYQQPAIITGTNMAPFLQNPFMNSPPLGNRNNDDSFHGSPTSWNINHSNNFLPSYLPTNNNNGNGINSFSQDLTQSAFKQPQQQFPRSSLPIQNFPFGFSQFQPAQQQQPPSNNFPSFPSSLPQQQSALSSAPQPFQMPLSGPDADFFINAQQQQPMGLPLGGNSNGGPIVVYVSQSDRGMAQTSASGPIPVRAFNNINEIPMDLGPKPQFSPNYFSGPPPGGPHAGNFISHGPSSTQSGSGTNPQYMRNNFLRMVMDKLASVGKALPIPFVTKYSGGYSRPTGHLSRRM